MFPYKLLTLMLTLLGLTCFFMQAQAAVACNPLAATCPANPGLGFQSYFVDFTKESSLPANWTLANYENVTYGANGAEFTFFKRGDAPSIWTDFYILFGHIEVVMQAAPGIGIISSLVLLSDDGDEIDWEFSGNNFNNRSGLGETNYFGKGINTTYDRAEYAGVDSPQTQFYSYSIDWSPNSLIWSIDGIPVRTLSNTNANSGPYQYPQSPMKLQIGLWDAGDADGAPATVEWAGGYTDVSKAPFTMYVKSLRIFNLNPCSGGYQYTDMSGSFQSIKCLYTDSLSSSNSTPVPNPAESNPAGSAPASSSLPASTGTSTGDTSGTMAPTSSTQSSTVIVLVQTSSSTTALATPLAATSSVETACDSTMVAPSSSPSPSPSPPSATTSAISSSLTTTCTSTPITSTSQAPVSSSSNDQSTAMIPSQASVCTSPTAIPSAPATSANAATASDSTSLSSSASFFTTESMPTTASTISTTSPTAPRTSSSQIPFSTQSTNTGTKLRPWTGWLLFFG